MTFLIRFRWILTSVLLMLALAGIPFIQKAVVPNNELNIWFLKDDPILKSYQDFNDEYGNDRIVILMLHHPNGVFQPEILRKLKHLTAQLPQLEGIKRVYSLTNFRDLYRIKINDTTRIKYQSPFANGIPESMDSLLHIKELIQSSPIFQDLLITNDGNTTLILVELNHFNEVDHLREVIVEDLENMFTEVFSGEEIALGGLDVITHGFNKLSKHDFLLFMGMNYLIMFISVFLMYRRWSFVTLVLMVITISIMLMLGIYGLSGKQLNIFTLVIPALVAILGLFIVLHIINEYQASFPKFRQEGKIKAVQLCLGKVFKPCLFTTLTTIIGFLALLSSSTVVLRDFGLFSAVGILLVFIVAFTISAALLPIISVNESTGKSGNWILRFLISALSGIKRYSKQYTIGFLIIVPLMVIGIRRINPDMFILGYMSESSEAIRNHRKILQYWGNYFPLDFLIDASDQYNFSNTSMVRALGNFQQDVENIEEIRSTFSVYNLIDRSTNVVLHKNLEAITANPANAQRFLKRFLTGENLDLSKYVSKDLKTVRVTLTGPIVSVGELEHKIDLIEGVFAKHFGDKAQISVTSYPALFLRIMKYAIESMYKSLALALVLIFVALVILLRDLKMAFIAMLPNLFPLGILFATMGYTGINLDLATCTVACIALGIAVDDTIHLLYHYQHYRKFNTVPDSLLNAHAHVGRIIVTSSIILCGGYLVLMMASVMTVVYFGFLSVVVVIGAFIGDIFLLPLLIHKFYIQQSISTGL